MSNKIYCGIDVGSNGAIIILHPDQSIGCYTIPKVGKEIDLVSLNKIFVHLKALSSDIHICFENLRAIYGSSAGATFSFGWINGVIEALCVIHNIPYTKVHSKTWQKEMFQGIPEILKPGLKVKKIDTKAMSILASKRLYPTFSLKATERSSKDHDGISDALMIATYCKRKF